jgi:DNA-binding transcriptional regulator GbsR (MarR family)
MTPLTPSLQKFVLHWGEMGTRWGINRTVAQIHALLFMSQKPLTAEEIMGTLSVARSNVSNSLKELQNWGIIKVVHVMGDRRDHFESLKDVWAMFKLVLAERKRREVDPTLQILKECIGDMEKENKTSDTQKQRLKDMLEFFETGTACFEDIHRLSPAALRKIGKISGKITKLLGMGTH